ncbi:hypothetical protein [Novosphingobium sp. BW1]|uniref:hypothetical protein n=1 Tax=Novosphingobium sp. BW1 TaxID=2592621 RepID=UPI0011DE7056|nr:hypothetical protein [Novosphingobium sp. BW1]TYC93011.1 hypothetical protein FMM79_03215 [Novosphingobium sp. BW1]
MTEAILHILQHSLGVDQYGRGEQYRNHFVTGEGSVDFPACIAATLFGLMNRRQGNVLSGGDDVFRVTPEGKRWMAENSPVPPKLTRSQRRYRAYLDADWFTGNFREWIAYWRDQPKGVAHV